MKQTEQPLRYPVGIQTFSEIRGEGYVYVDKTAYVHRLVNDGKYYFLSRPRRFGKSLLLSTIEAYFSGQRELFQGLAIDSLTEKWEKYPVLHLDLNSRDYSYRESLTEQLVYHLERWENIYGCVNADRKVEERFANVIEQAYLKTGKPVVILVDEYDKPMLNAINDEKLSDHFRSTLKAFYGNLKSKDAFIKFAMMTGVARFSKVSIFSDLNNLRDISFQADYSAICGITNEEVDRYFRQGVSSLAEACGQTYDEAREELRQRYDGYHFSGHLIDIYNPFSLVNVFASNEYGNYWFNSGTPTHIVELLKRGQWQLRNIEQYEIDKDKLSSESILTSDPIPSLYQAGYITIREYDQMFNQYILGYPNKEVEEGFVKFLLPMYLGTNRQSQK